MFALNNLCSRFPSVLLVAGTSWLLFLITKKLFNAKSRDWAVVLINLSAVFTIAIGIIISQRNQQTVEIDVKPFFDDVNQMADIPVIRNGIDEMHLQAYYCKKFHLPAKALDDYPLYRQLIGKPAFGK